MAKQPNALTQLTREEMTPPPIQPVPAGVKRPRWSVMIPTYNCAGFLRETIESVLSHEFSPSEMQIEVVDDCSTADDPEDVVRKFGQGRVSFFRKSVNEGAIANFNTCIERSTGHYVHILHGDDFVKPGFYNEIGSLIDSEDGELALYTCCSEVVDESSRHDHFTKAVPQLLSRSWDASSFYSGNRLLTPSCVVKRTFYECHGGFLPVLIHTADWEMWARAISVGGAVMLPKHLAAYRNFAHNDTSRLKKTGENITDTLRLGTVFQSRYCDFDFKVLLSYCAGLAESQAELFSSLGDAEASSLNLRLLNKLNTSLDTKSPIIGWNKMFSTLFHPLRNKR